MSSAINGIVIILFVFANLDCLWCCVQTGYQVRLSQQELVDCSWGEGNNGCDGGEDVASYKWIIENGGLSSEEEYGHYLAVVSIQTDICCCW